MPSISVVNLVRSELGGYMADTEGDILDLAVNKYMAGKLSPEDAYAIVGEISGLRRLSMRMEREATQEATRYRKTYEEGQQPEEDERG